MPGSSEKLLIKGEIYWRITRENHKSPWVGVCKALKLTAQAETWEEITQDISWVVKSVFSDLLKTGDLHEFLKNRGWSCEPSVPELGDPQKIKTLDIPFYLLKPDDPKTDHAI